MKVLTFPERVRFILVSCLVGLAVVFLFVQLAKASGPDFPMPQVDYQMVTDKNGNPDPKGRMAMVINFHKGQKLTHKGDTVTHMRDIDKFGTELGQSLYPELWAKLDGHSLMVMGEYQIIIRKWPLFPFKPMEIDALKICEKVLKVYYGKKGKKKRKK